MSDVQLALRADAKLQLALRADAKLQLALRADAKLQLALRADAKLQLAVVAAILSAGCPQPKPSEGAPPSREPAPRVGDRVAVSAASAGHGGSQQLSARQQSQLERAEAYVEADELEKAAAAVEPVLDAVPGNPRALKVRVRVLNAQGRKREALEAAEQCVESDATEADCWMAIGELTHDAGWTADAWQAYKRYLELEPNGRHAWQARGALRSLERLQRRKQVRDAWKSDRKSAPRRDVKKADRKRDFKRDVKRRDAKMDKKEEKKEAKRRP